MFFDDGLEWKNDAWRYAGTVERPEDVTAEGLLEVADRHGVLVESVLKVVLTCRECAGRGNFIDPLRGLVPCFECHSTGKRWFTP